MKAGWKLGVYIGAASAVGLIILVVIFLVVRFHLRKKQKKTIANGILGQLGLSQQAPDFTIPLMMPMFVQDQWSLDGEVFDPVQDNWPMGMNAPSLIQPEGDFEIIEMEEVAGPTMRRLESVMDVSLFPDETSFETRPKVKGPWSSSRRESLFFPSSLFGFGRPRSNTSTSASEATSASPKKPERRNTVGRRKRSTSESSPTGKDKRSSLRPRIASEMGSLKRKPAAKPLLTKKTSLPEGSMRARFPLKKRFSEINRRQMSSDNLLGKSSKVLPSTKRGTLILNMRHSKEENRLMVHLINATDLPMKNDSLLDTFARIYLVMPSKQQRQQSKLHKKTCNPIYDETFIFEDINYSELLQSYLRIKILHKDGFSRGEMIGESAFDLSDQELVTGKVLQRSLLPKATSITEDGPGQLLLSVCHYATTAQLKVTVIKMKDLPKSCKNSTVSVELIFQDEILQRQQTRSKKPKKSPVFNEELNFHIPTSSSDPLENYSLQFSVFSQDILRGMVCVGYVTLGLDAPWEPEVEHWKTVVTSPHKPVTAWHKFHRTPV